MKIKLTVKKEFDVKTLKVSAGVRYWEDSTINGIDDDEHGSKIPCKVGENWEPIINVDDGKITNWIDGVTASIHYKVCDDGLYSLYDSDDNFITEKSGYVPDIMCPKEEGYGDYIIMDIDESGFIQDWKCNLSEFTEEEEE